MITYQRLIPDSTTPEQKAVWDTEHNGLVGHMLTTSRPMYVDEVLGDLTRYFYNYRDDFGPDFPFARERVVAALEALANAGFARRVRWIAEDSVRDVVAILRAGNLCETHEQKVVGVQLTYTNNQIIFGVHRCELDTETLHYANHILSDADLQRSAVELVSTFCTTAKFERSHDAEVGMEEVRRTVQDFERLVAVTPAAIRAGLRTMVQQPALLSRLERCENLSYLRLFATCTDDERAYMLGLLTPPAPSN